MGTIYNLEYEYEHYNGQSIVFKEINGEKLSTSHLNSVQQKMMQSNRIPHLLGLTIENIDLSTKLHFNINSKNKVASFFRSNSTGMNDYYQLFLSIIKALEESGSYMLSQQNFILRSDFIYVGDNASDVYLVYLPIKDLKKQSNVTDEMKQLLTDIASEVEGLQGNEFKSILNYIKNPSFSLTGLKKLFLELISLRSNVNQFLPHENQVGADANHFQTVTQNTMPNNGIANKQQNLNPNQIDEVVPKSQRPKVKKKLPPLSSRVKVYLFAGVLLALALTWKLYDMYTTQIIFLVCSGLSLIIVAALVVYVKFWRPGVTPIEVPVEEKKGKKKVENQPIQQPTAQQNPQSNMGMRSNVYQQNYPQQERTFIPNFQDFSTQQPVAAAAVDTSFLMPQSDDTVLLEDESNLNFSQMGEEKLALLQRTGEDGKTIKIVINQKNFLIGRNADSVHYTEDATGVSRIHAEIIKIDATSYGLKDLGSKNGTKLNGNALVPYKVYALNENDEFTIGKSSYKFKWSSTE